MLLSLFGLFGAKAQNDLTTEEFAKALTPETCLIDVRTHAEYKDGHLVGAVNIDWFGSHFVDKVKEKYDKTTPLYLYCRSGKRSAAAAKALAKEGYTVYNMLGGYKAWLKEERPVMAE